MTKDQLISPIKKFSDADIDLKFLAKLDLPELKTLVSKPLSLIFSWQYKPSSRNKGLE